VFGFAFLTARGLSCEHGQLLRPDGVWQTRQSGRASCMQKPGRPRVPENHGKSWKKLIKIDGSASASKNKTGEWGAFGAHRITPMTAPIDPQIPPPCSALP